LGGRKGIWPVKTEWWGAGMVVSLERGTDLHMAQLMPLPLTVSCFSKIQIGLTFLVPADLGIPGQSEVKRVCVYVCSCWALLRLASLCDRSALMYTVRQVHQSRRLPHLASDGLDGMMLSLIVEWTIITHVSQNCHIIGQGFKCFWSYGGAINVYFLRANITCQAFITAVHRSQAHGTRFVLSFISAIIAASRSATDSAAGITVI